MKHGYNQIGKRRPEYKAWDAVIQRCTNAGDTRYYLYGARGVMVCDGWRDFRNFIADVGDKPNGTSLGRPNNDGHYSCGHCVQCKQNGWALNAKWETPLEQQNNTRRSHFVELHGQRVTLAQAARLLGWPYEVIPGRLRIGWPLSEALSVPYPAKRGSR